MRNKCVRRADRTPTVRSISRDIPDWATREAGAPDSDMTRCACLRTASRWWRQGCCSAAETEQQWTLLHTVWHFTVEILNTEHYTTTTTTTTFDICLTGAIFQLLCLHPLLSLSHLTTLTIHTSLTLFIRFDRDFNTEPVKIVAVGFLQAERISCCQTNSIKALNAKLNHLWLATDFAA